MEITNVLTETVKDVVAISKSVAKVVKDEVELYFDQKKDFADEMEDEDDEDYNETKSLFDYWSDIDGKFREVINTTFSGFKSSRTEEQEELEARISALEEKISKLVEESLSVIKKDKK